MPYFILHVYIWKKGCDLKIKNFLQNTQNDRHKYLGIINWCQNQNTTKYT